MDQNSYPDIFRLNIDIHLNIAFHKVRANVQNQSQTWRHK